MKFSTYMYIWLIVGIIVSLTGILLEVLIDPTNPPTASFILLQPGLLPANLLYLATAESIENLILTIDSCVGISLLTVHKDTLSTLWLLFLQMATNVLAYLLVGFLVRIDVTANQSKK